MTITQQRYSPEGLKSMAPDPFEEAPRNAPPPVANEHPVFQVPFSVIIDGRSYEGAGISVVGCSAKGLVSPHLDGERRVVVLQFAFPGFNVGMPVDTRIEDSSPDHGWVRLSFLDPTGPHLPQLRYLLNAFVGGDLIGLDRVIVAADGSIDEVQSRRTAGGKKAGGLLGRSVRLAALGVATVLLVGFIADKLYERFMVIPVGGLPIVSVEGTTLRAISAGQLEFVAANPKKGEPAFAIRTITGEVVTIQMPCDCEVAAGTAPVGATVVAGDPVMQVAPPNSPVVVKATITPDTLRALIGGAEARVDLPSGQGVSATLAADSVGAAAFAPRNATGIDISLAPVGGLPESLVGTPVSVAILTHPLPGWLGGHGGSIPANAEGLAK